ncbi:biotin--[acetyl-CoA-carboxylase] ligase [Piscinibacter sakaiensis]|uniref:biotin--[biotin carboxyl-carrier protein] ligase n=1 Tax=Piscinibacter sakaiensis TaxID=1547922 RepID=A0A0K8NVQ2_PISS1|nr:biotin--[acetyl-CoA-carboxylase] ligase [Piscinibacter sakaiensis]GAP34471.1 biotin-protein ligase [Piscinibacter sakaiensis]
MADTRLHWGAEALWEALEPLLPGLSVEVVASLPSTNTTLIERARADHADVLDTEAAGVRRSVESSAFGRRSVDWQPCLLVAEEQTAGRGRLGRSWHAEPLASLSFSLALPLAPRDWSGLSLAVGLAIADALEPPQPGAAPRLLLKWPNDLWLRDAAGADGAPGRKLGGILIETVAAGARRLVVVGVGLNVAAPRGLRAAEASTGVAALQELDPAARPPQVLARLARPLVEALLRFEREGLAPCLAGYAARDLLRDLPVSTTRADAPEGTARGIADDGSLRLQTPAGELRLHSGEVSVRPRRPALAGRAAC